MGIRKQVVVLLVLFVALTGCEVRVNTGSNAQTPARAGTASEQAAVRAAAEAVLVDLDAEQWDKALRASSAWLRQTHSVATFSRGVGTTRTMLGAPKTRTIKGYGFPASLADAPPGEYGVVFYRSDFARVDGVDERVVLVHEGGAWRLAGYWAQKKF